MAIVYRPIFFSPNQEARDMLQAQDFSCVVQSTTTDYQLVIFDLEGTAILYDSTKITLGTPVYAGETLTITVPITPAMATERDLKWTIVIYNGSDSVVSKEVPFTNYEDPTVSLSGIPATITQSFYEFTAVYNQNQGIEVNRYKYTLYDDTQTEITNSGWIYNSSVKYTFENFIDDDTYYVEIEVYDQNDLYATSGLESFLVNYTQPTLIASPEATNNKETSAIDVAWPALYDLEGTTTGTGTYISDFIDVGNYGYQLTDVSYTTWTGVDMDESNWTYSGFWQPSSTSATAVIMRADDTSGTSFAEVGYDGTYFYSNSFVFPEAIFVRTEAIALYISKVYLVIAKRGYIDVKILTP